MGRSSSLTAGDSRPQSASTSPRRTSSIAATPPEGLIYAPEFISPGEEQELVDEVREMQFQDVHMHGVVARRRVIHFGWDYGYESWKIEAVEPIPPLLHPLRERCALMTGEEPERLEQVLIARYPPGAGIGWHRDAPMFGPAVFGVSLLADTVMRFRRRTDPGFEIYKQPLARRSAYVLTAAARSAWQHSIPAVREERFSITFRTIHKSSSQNPEPQ